MFLLKEHRKKRRNGFTLVEILITVSIIVLMSTIALARFVNPDPQTEFDDGMKQVVSQIQLMRTYAKSVKQCCTDTELSRPPYPNLGYAMKFYYNTEESPNASEGYMFYADADTPEDGLRDDEYENNDCAPEGCDCGPDGCPDIDLDDYSGTPFEYEPGGFDEVFYQGLLPGPLEFFDCTTMGFYLRDFYEAGFMGPECQIYMFRRPEEGFAINDAGSGPPYIDVVFQHEDYPEIKGTVRIYNTITTIEYIPGEPEPPFENDGVQPEDIFNN